MDPGIQQPGWPQSPILVFEALVLKESLENYEDFLKEHLEMAVHFRHKLLQYPILPQIKNNQ